MMTSQKQKKSKRVRETLKKTWDIEHYMNFPEKKIYDIVEKSGNSICDCYHYTTMDTFWNMINSDLMYARHVRFSNDSKEYKLGEKIINNLLGYENEGKKDFYMICFCTKRDLLSQWREYAKGGVCLGFDLSEEDYYTILCNDITQRINENNSISKELVKYTLPKHGKFNQKECVYAYTKLLRVVYVGKKHKKISKKYEQINKIVFDGVKDKYMHCMIPYIKHKGFKEEEEARLIFSPSVNDIEYQVNYLEEGGIKKPYIKVEFGEIEEKISNKCKVIADYIGDFSDELREGIANTENSLGVKISLEIRDKYANGQITIGCCKQQKEIFNRIDYWVQGWNFKNPNKQISVWCKGHLPIREIIIGPCLNRKAVHEGVQHFINNVYWLKYAKVKCSDIPYREKRDR